MPRRTILITGCGPNGIGRALATEFQLRGHRVIASGLNELLLTPLKEQGLETVVLDVTSQASIDAAVDHVSQLTGGKLDIVINNAGLMHIMPFADTSITAARRLLEVNVLGVFAMTQATLPLLLASEGQSIVANLGSVNAVFLPPFFSVYNASKAAVEALGTSIRRELAPLGVRVVTLKTGSIKSDLFENAPETKLPQGSLYAPIREWIEGRKMLESGRYMEADAYAKNVVDELLRPSVKHIIWQGGLSTLAWFLSWFGWESILDGEMIKGDGLDKIKRPS